MSEPHHASVEDLPWHEIRSPSGRLRMRARRLSAAAEADRLGATLYEIPVGEKSWPFHFHLANEEAIFVLAGAGRVRRPSDELTIGPGDYVVFPVGEEGAHQIENTGEEPLRFLCLSTMLAPDIAVYPDSGKVGLFGGAAPGQNPETRTLFEFLRRDSAVDYWEGEDG